MSRYLRKGLFTIGVLDHIDYNPSSTSAQGSLHGTAISIIQNQTRENSGIGRNVTFKTEIADQPSLPESFALIGFCSKHECFIHYASSTENGGLQRSFATCNCCRKCLDRECYASHKRKNSQ